MKKTVFLAFVFMAVGCNNLKDVRTELEKGGYTLWYPAESGVEPGQIWITNGKEKYIQQRRPNQLTLFGPNRVKFQTLSKKVDANLSLNASFSEGVLGEAEELAVLLKSATVKEVTLDFGETRVSRLVLGDLSDPNIIEQLPKGYLRDLEKVQTVTQYVLISGIVTSSGMKYIFKCEDTKQLEAKVPEIRKLIKGEFSLNVKDNTEASWEIPETDVLAIGTTLVSGQTVQLFTLMSEQSESVQVLITAEDAKTMAVDVQNALLELRTRSYEMVPIRP